ncbi:GNAT family N-acetyltransferase [Actinoplanes sp. HUAS TT8]|uniref:GNAT family N-acetyltransferase n=1 Tax=Actinoplanes sp. HUAS TT8 TaxID=3447453 RepID=UPI003F520674
MNSVRTAVLTRPAEWQWHALSDDLVVGRGEATRRPDGRLFLSVDAWHDTVFHQLAEAMLAALPRPLFTVVDEADVDLTARWRDAGLAIGRREWEYVIPTDPIITGLAVAAPPGDVPVAATPPVGVPLTAAPPVGVTIVPLGHVREDLLLDVDRAIRAENLPAMPAEVLNRPAFDPSRYAAAEQHGRYVGLLRLAPLPRRPRIGLIAVRSDLRGIGIGRALLADVLTGLHRRGIETAAADVHEHNPAARALIEGARARRVSSNLELELR